MPLKHVGDFSFDEQVVDVFPDMIARSVPGYASRAGNDHGTFGPLCNSWHADF